MRSAKKDPGIGLELLEEPALRGFIIERRRPGAWFSDVQRCGQNLRRLQFQQGEF